MTDGWIQADRVFDGRDVYSGLGLRIKDGVVAEVGTAPDTAQYIAGTITPGFVDLQVNGGGGVMVNTSPTPEGLRLIAGAHSALGTTSILPTVITDTPEVLEAAAQAVMAVQDPAILGLHIEGPHIAVAKRGTHAAAFIRPLDRRTMDVVARLRDAAVTVMITLAPEAATTEQIRQLVQMGAIVSLGHTDATGDQIVAAIAAGARCGTHLFNAMSQMTGRARGAVGALINSHCALGIICDGHHVSDEMIALALRARPAPELMFLVSDAMATVGGPQTFDLYGQTIHVTGGKLVNAEGNLAGAHVTQAQGVKRLLEHVGLNLEAALRMAITVPSDVIRRPDLAQIVGRHIEALIVLDGGLNCAALSRLTQ